MWLGIVVIHVHEGSLQSKNTAKCVSLPWYGAVGIQVVLSSASVFTERIWSNWSSSGCFMHVNKLSLENVVKWWNPLLWPCVLTDVARVDLRLRSNFWSVSCGAPALLSSIKWKRSAECTASRKWPCLTPWTMLLVSSCHSNNHRNSSSSHFSPSWARPFTFPSVSAGLMAVYWVWRTLIYAYASIFLLDCCVP